MSSESLRDRLVKANLGGEVVMMSDGYGSFVHFTHEEVADRVAAVVVQWLRDEAAVKSTHAGILRDWILQAQADTIADLADTIDPKENR